MVVRDRLDEIVALLREVELDDARWPAASALIDDTCGLQGSDLMLATIHGGFLEADWRRLLLHGERRPELERDYENYAAVDERPNAGLRMGASGGPVHVDELLTDFERRTSICYNEYLVPNAGENSLAAWAWVPELGDRFVVWSLVGPGGGAARDWTTEQVDAIRLLFPHVCHFARVRQALADARSDGMRTMALLGTDHVGLLLLDRHGCVVEANDRARALLRGDGLTDRGGFLHAVPPADVDGVGKLLAEVCRGVGGGSMRIARAGLTPLVLHATPVPTASGADAVAARVVVADPFSAPRFDECALAAALGLTPRQAGVVAALAAGGTVGSIVAETGRSEHAVRWHVRIALDRLGLSRQADLVRLVLSTPGVLDADTPPDP